MTSDRQTMFSGTKDVEPHLRLDTARLTRYLEQHIEDFCGPLEVHEFKGGQSNPTYQLVTPTERYVLRRKPPGKLLPSAHAVDREYRVLCALHAQGFPVARPHALCTDDNIVGTMFYVMEFVTGRVFWEMSLPQQSKAERGAIYDQMISMLAKLQGYDYRELGLEGFGKPHDYFARQINRWTKNYRASETDVIPDMERLNRWLADNVPADESPCVVHGDYRLDNIIFHPTEPRVIAVLDWELSTLGHPLGDFSYHLSPWLIPPISDRISTLVGHDLEALGIPSADAYAARYCELTGRDSVPDLNYYNAYTVWRIAAIYQGIIKRVQNGTAASADAPRTTEMVREFAALGCEFAQRAGMP